MSSVFNGIRVFVATMMHQRATLGEEVTAWLEQARRTRPGFEVVDIVVRQSSDEGYHCVSITLFFNEDLSTSKKEKRRG